MSNVAQIPAAQPPARNGGLLDKMSSRYGIAPDIFERTVAAVAMPKEHTREELISCLVVANEHNLNPLTKEIYFMRTRAGVIQPIVGVDGWIKKLNEHPQFDGMDIVENDDDKGNLVSCTISIFRKDRKHPTKITEWLAECRGQTPPWKTLPRRMLRNRTICQGARVAMGFAGIMEIDEFIQWQGVWMDPREVPSDPMPKVLKAPALDLPDIPDEAPVKDETDEAREAIGTAISVEMLNHLRETFPDADWEALNGDVEKKHAELSAKA